MFGGHTRERGQVLPLVALLLLVLLAFTGMAVDIGYLRYQQRIQQSAADSAAIAGAAELGYGTDFQAAARAGAAVNGFTDGVNNVTVSATSPPSSGNYTNDSSAVEVSVVAHYNTFFMRLFRGLATSSIKTRAVALRSDSNLCLYLLSPSGDSNLNSANIQAPNCGVAINQTKSIDLHNATIDAKSILYAGAAPNEDGATFASATPQPSLPISDPCMQIAGCRYLTNNPPPTNPCTSKYDGSGYVTAGCYNGDDWKPKSKNKSSTVVMNAGLYVITGNLDAGGVTLQGSDVTFYITGNGKLTLNGATLNLSAPATGPYAGVLMYQAASDTHLADLTGASCGGCSSTINGLLYFPTARVNYNHHGGGYTVSVFGDGNFNKSDGDYSAPSAGAALVKKAVLAE